MFKYMKFMLLFIFMSCQAYAQVSVKPPALSPISNAQLAGEDLFLVWDNSVGITKKLSVTELDLRFAPVGNYITSLTGDVTGLGPGAASTTIAAGAVTNVKISNSAAIDASKIANGSVSNTEFQLLDGVTSGIQTQIDGKMANPMTTAGDTMYGGASGTPTRLAAGLQGQFLSMGASSVPAWSDPLMNLDTSGTVTITDAHRGKTMVYDATLAGPTVDLPAVSGREGFYVTIYKSDNSANPVIISANGSEVIRPGGTTTKTLSKQDQWVTLQVIGGAWVIRGFDTAKNILAASSATKDATGVPSSSYFNMSGNSLTLAQGVYQISANARFSNAGSSPAYDYTGIGVFGANGADTTSAPAALSTVVTVNSQNQSVGSLTVWHKSGTLEDVLVDATRTVTVGSSGATIYAVPACTYTTAANARIIVSINATQIGF